MMKYLLFTHRQVTRKGVGLWILLILGLLACSLGTGTSDSVRIRKTLPTFTPTVGVISWTKAAAEPPVSVQEISPSTQTAGSEAPPGQSPSAPSSLLPEPATMADSSQPAVAPPASTSTLAEPALPPSPTPTLALSFEPTATVATSAPLPGATSTSVSQSPATPTPTQTSAPNPTATLPAPAEPTATPTTSLPPEVNGWSFLGVNTSIDETEAVVVGELLNNTGIPQTEVHVSGTFYDQNNQAIIDGIEALGYVPIDIIPAGARVPFELVVESQQPIYRLDLAVRSEPTSNPPRQDFQFANVKQWTNPTGLYCIDGQVQNLGTTLNDYLVILATAYNGEGQLIGFGEYASISPETLVGEEISPFELCIDPLDQQIGQHQLIALGR